MRLFYTKMEQLRSVLGMETVSKISQAMPTFQKLFGRKDAVFIGAVHLGALPGTPRNSKSFQEIIDSALSDANIYLKHGMDGIIVENTNDVPYLKSSCIGPEITASMTRVCTEIRRKHPKAVIGIQVLAGGNTHALSIAQACGLNFIRAEGFVYSHVGDEGFIDACAGPLLRYRKQIGAENVLVFADIKKKHSSHAITGDLSVQEIAQAAENFMADAVIITGKSTGRAPDPQESTVTKKLVQLPVLLGSGITSDNLHAFINQCHGIIVGSDLKKDGNWINDVEEKRVKDFMETVETLRKTIAKEDADSDKPKPTTSFIG